MSVGENIRKLREEWGYTQKQLAEIIHVKEQYMVNSHCKCTT
jgi:DNA-binding XRE family transcriptional regulator